MNADEVCAMIDAVTGGREYTYHLTEGNLVSADTEGVLFSPGLNDVFDVTDPRQAREIAGLLVAWASAKEKNQ